MPLDNDIPRSRLTSLIEREQRKESLENRWHREGWVKCGECEGFGFNEDMSDEIPCTECGGAGEVKLPFWDWIDTLDENDPANVVPVPLMGSINAAE